MRLCLPPWATKRVCRWLQGSVVDSLSSISQLTRGSKLTRQGVTKHLRVLERAGIVRCVHAGRESLFEFEQKSIEEMKDYLDFVSRQWDQALSRLKAFVED